MGVGGSINILFKADLTKYVAHRPSVLYWVLQPGSNVGGIGMGLVRMVRPWNEWLIDLGLRHQPAAAARDRGVCQDVALEPDRRPLDPGRDQVVVDLDGQSHVRHDLSEGPRVLHGRRGAPPSAVQRSRLQHLDPGRLQPAPGSSPWCSRGRPAPRLLDTYSAERAPIGKQIVERANKSIGEFGPIFGALGLLDSTDPDVMKANMEARKEDTRRGEGAPAEAARGDRLQGLRVRRARRRDEPVLRLRRRS